MVSKFKEPNPELNRLAKQVFEAALEVHRLIGPGYLESVYEEALCVEFGLRGIAFERQVETGITYKNVRVGRGRVDFVVAKRLIVELKSVEALVPVHTAQVISYLKATGLTLALLINFNVPLLKDGVRRIINS